MGNDYKADAAEWVRVAESKWAHYQQIVERDDRAEDVAVRIHQHQVAKMVPHLVAVIRALGEAEPGPRRDSDVAGWLKRHRDLHDRQSETWWALDWLLDDYRNHHADTGTPLTDEVAGPHPEEG